MKNDTLSHLDPEGEIVLKTDASKTGIAGLLQQLQEDEWRIITCCSRGLTTSERNYPITELEALAVVYSLNKLQYYLFGRKHTILVDYRAQQVWNKLKLPNNERLQRWSLILSDYDCKLVYVKGRLHEDVDLLSRASIAIPVEDDACSLKREGVIFRVESP